MVTKTESDLTWRKVKLWCTEQFDKLQSSKESEKIACYRVTVKDLQSKIDSFEKRLSMYRRMSNLINLNDPDIDTPFGEEKERS